MRRIEYVARWNGVVIGTRSSPRPYQFAVVCQFHEDKARAVAYDYVATETDRKNFAYYSAIVAQGVEHPHVRPERWRPNPVLEVLERAKGQIDGGFDAYIARLREHAIKNFEARKAEGFFGPRVSGWSMSRPNAEKMAASCRSSWQAVLGIVPAEVE